MEINIWRRFFWGLVIGFGGTGISFLVNQSPVLGTLHTLATVGLLSALLFGPAGWLGTMAAYLLVEFSVGDLTSIPRLVPVFSNSIAGIVGFSIFRWVPNLGRGLPNLRSFVFFLGSAALGSSITAAVACSIVFPSVFWTAAWLWMGSSMASFLLLAPPILILADRWLRPWLFPIPGEVLGATKQRESAERNEQAGRVEGTAMPIRDFLAGGGLILAVTLVVVPLSGLEPDSGSWLLLLYLAPILWASYKRGMRAGLIATSAAGLAFLIGQAVVVPVVPQLRGHINTLDHFAYLLIFSLVGVVTGAYQQEHKRVQAETRDNERRFKTLCEASFEGIGVTDQERVLFANSRLAEMLGIDLDELFGRQVSDFVAPESRELVLEHSKSGLETPYQHLARREDGSIFPIEVLSRSMLFEGRTVRVTALRDVTERRQAEAALRESEQRYRLLADNVSDVMFVVDLEARFTYVSPSIQSLLGFSVDELLGKGVEAILDPEASALAREKLDQALQRVDDPDFDMRLDNILDFDMRRQDGSVVATEAKVSFLWGGDDRPNAILGVARDVSARKQAQAELQESEARYRQLVEDQTEVITCWQPDGILTFVNEAYCRLLDTPREELLGTSLYRLLSEEDGETLRRKVGDLSPANPAAISENQMILPSGKFPWMEWTDRGIFDDSGRLLELRSIGREISDRKLAKTALLESRERLRGLANRLQTVREEERTEIAREIHDELGQALTGLKMDLSWLSASSSDSPKTVLSRVRSMISLVDMTLQNVRRLASRLRPAILDDLGLTAAIEWQVDSFSERTGCDCELDIEVEPLNLNPNRDTAIFRILQEALTNVTRHAEATRVRVRLRVQNADLVLEVQDNGRGILDEQIKASESLGLLGMRERALALGGRVDIELVPGGGTLVKLTMPIKDFI